MRKPKAKSRPNGTANVKELPFPKYIYALFYSLIWSGKYICVNFDPIGIFEAADCHPETQAEFHPSKTFFIMSTSWAQGGNSSMDCDFGTQRGEHRYSKNGTLYFPQKSTNFICSNRESKYTPLHWLLTHRWALLR